MFPLVSCCPASCSADCVSLLDAYSISAESPLDCQLIGFSGELLQKKKKKPPKTWKSVHWVMDILAAQGCEEGRAVLIPQGGWSPYLCSCPHSAPKIFLLSSLSASGHLLFVLESEFGCSGLTTQP